MTFYNMLVFYGGRLDPCPTPKLKDDPLSTTSYSIYLQLPSTSGGHFLYVQREDAHCRSNKKFVYHGPSLPRFYSLLVHKNCSLAVLFFT